MRARLKAYCTELAKKETVLNASNEIEGFVFKGRDAERRFPDIGHFELISTGGTYTTLHNNGIDVTPVSEVTGFPEILDGRVKTLHPNVHAALLAVGDNPDHMRQVKHHDIEPIDMVVVNLYPFEQTVARETVSFDDAIVNIDIGGPAMLRSASKNFRHKAVGSTPTATMRSSASCA